MALNFQDLPIPLVEGQDASADGSLIPMPSFLKVTNGEFADRKNIRAVDGLTGLVVTAMTGETAPDDVNPTLRRLLTHKDELLLETYKGTYRQQVGGSFALAAGKNNPKRDALRAMRAGVTSMAEAQASPSDDWSGPVQVASQIGIAGVDAAVLGDYICVVWAESFTTSAGATAGQVGWLIRHRTSDALVGRGRIRSMVYGNTTREPRVVAFGGSFHVFGIDTAVGTGSVGRRAIAPTATQNVTESFTDFVDTNVATFDVALSTTQFCITTGNSGAGGLSHWVYAQAAPSVLIGGGGVVTGSTPINVSNAWVSAANEFVGFCVAAGTTGTLRWCRVSTAGVVSVQGTQAFAGVNLLRTFAFKEFGGTATRRPVLVETFGAAPQNYDTQVVIYDYSSGGAAGNLWTSATLNVVVREHQVASQPVFVSEPTTTFTGVEEQGLYLGAIYASNAQNVFQVIDIARSITRVIAGGQTDSNFSVLRVFDCGAAWPVLSVGSAMGRACQPVPVPGESLAWHFWCAKFTPNITNVTQLGQNPTNIQRNTLRLLDLIGSIEFADLTYMAGGCPLVYDGQDIFEEGFTFAPEAVSVTPSGAGGPLSAGLYGIVFVYEWFDGQGNRWQSQVSPATTFTAVLANTYTAVVRSLRTTLKSGVQVIPYRTTAGDTIYRRDSPLGTTPLTDAQIASSEPLYTGGVLSKVGFQSNNALPGVKNFTVHQNRLVGIGGEFERGFFYSKERSLRFPAEFNRASGFGLVPEVTGRVVAGSSIDGKLALFAENGISVVFGQGPNLLWAQNGFTTPERIQAAEGIRFDSPFIAEVDDGVWYVTSLGPRLFTRGLATAKGQNGPLGDELRSAGQTLIGACEAVVVHPVKAQVLFRSNADGLTYIYDYQRNKWTQRDDFGTTVTSMVSARGVLYLIRSTTFANLPLQFEDPSSTVRNTLTLETGWVSFAGVQRFQRCSHIQVLGSDGPKGDFTSNYLVRLRVLSLEQPGVQVQDTTVTLLSNTSSNTPWQAEFQMAKQTDTAYKLLISVNPDDSGGNFSITNLLARVGQKRGGAKLSSAQRG